MKFIALLRMSIAAWAVLCLDISPATACECVRVPTCQGLWDARLAFVGTPEVTQVGQGKEEARFAVTEWLRGERVDRELTIISDGVGISCDANFESGATYLVFAYKDSDGRWKATACSNFNLAHDRGLLEEMRRALRSRGTGSLSGSIYIDTDPGEPIRPGAPVADAKIVLKSSEREFTARSNAEGSFEFRRLPRGEYSMVVGIDNPTILPGSLVTIGGGSVPGSARFRAAERLTARLICAFCAFCGPG